MKHTQKGSDGEGFLFASLGLLAERLYALVRRREVVMMTGDKLRYDENGVLGQSQNIKGKLIEFLPPTLTCKAKKFMPFWVYCT